MNKVDNQRVKDASSFQLSKSMFPGDGILNIAVWKSDNCNSHAENAY